MCFIQYNSLELLLFCSKHQYLNLISDRMILNFIPSQSVMISTNSVKKVFSCLKTKRILQIISSCTAAKKNFLLFLFFLVENQFCTLFTIIYLSRQKTLNFNRLCGESTSTLSCKVILFGNILH